MDRRPPAIEIRSHSHGPLGTTRDAFARPLPSPRLHIAGEVPPDLSPLDAFAAQSRMLARKLEEGAREGKRLSRLPPLSLEESLVAPRPSYLRSASAQEPIIQPEPPRSPGFALNMDLEGSSDRHMSVHPRFSKVPTPGAGSRSGTPTNVGRASEDSDRGRQSIDPRSLMGNQREEALRRARQIPAIQTNTGNSPRFSNYTQDEGTSRGREGRGLAPPRSPLAQTSSTFVPTSSPEDGQRDGGARGAEAALRPSLRKFSSSSVLSVTSPISPSMYSQPRSPSACSDMSSANGLPRPAFNFSRPLSRAEPPPRQSSGDSDQLVLTDDSGVTPGLDSVGSFDSNHEGSSYVYSKFDLPRGKAIQRSAMPMDASLNFFGDDHLQGDEATAPPSPPYCPSPKQIAVDALPPSLTIGLAPKPPQSTATGVKSQLGEEEGSIEWHLNKGIDCHEAGSLNESTYHLRLAARKGSTTGMLLYALACRHGWGMRKNEAEGLIWLQKAVDLSKHEMDDDEAHVKAGDTVDIFALRTRKAQLGLSVYELGQSHLNGWGIAQNKPMALRCFELAGSWGDRDALAEAAFCYAQGVGTKKDLKKAARLYREAESKGLSMIGQSWIHKPKYQDEDPAKVELTKKKTRDKSQTRSIFGRKKA